MVCFLQSAHIEDLVIDSNKRGQKLGARCDVLPAVVAIKPQDFRLAVAGKHLSAHMFCLFGASEPH